MIRRILILVILSVNFTLDAQVNLMESRIEVKLRDNNIVLNGEHEVLDKENGQISLRILELEIYEEKDTMNLFFSSKANRTYRSSVDLSFNDSMVTILFYHYLYDELVKDWQKAKCFEILIYEDEKGQLNRGHSCLIDITEYEKQNTEEFSKSINQDSVIENMSNMVFINRLFKATMLGNKNATFYFENFYEILKKTDSLVNAGSEVGYYFTLLEIFHNCTTTSPTKKSHPHR